MPKIAYDLARQPFLRQLLIVPLRLGALGLVTTMATKGSRRCCCRMRVFLMSCFLATGVVLVVLGLVFRFNAGGIVSHIEKMEVDKVSVKDLFISVLSTL